MTKQTKTPKMPKIWVVFNADGVPIAVEFLASSARRYLASDTIRAYAPVEKKVCVWTYDGGEEWAWHPACNLNAVQRDADKYCPNCGGRIKTR